MVETGVCDCCYNISKQLSKKTEFLYHAERYLQDAEKCRHTKCADVMRRIIEDERKHVGMLKEIANRGIC